MAFGGVIRRADAPCSGLGSIGGDANTIWHCYSGSVKVYELSTSDFSVIRSADAPSNGPRGIGGDANTIWHSDTLMNEVYELSTSDLSEIRSAASPHGDPTGIGGAADTIWHCDLGPDEVYELSTSDFSVIRSGASPYTYPNGIGGDADTIWHCDQNAYKVYELDTSDFSEIRSADSPYGTTYPKGIGGDTNIIWFCANSDTYYYWIFELDAAPPVAPTVTTQAVSDIGATTATGNGTITDTGGVNCHTRGICWNTTGNPTTADSKAEDDGAGSYGVGPFSKSMTGLTPRTKYYVRAYAINSVGIGYGDQVEFTTVQVYTKTLTETISTADSIIKSPTKLLADNVTITDSLVIRIIGPWQATLHGEIIAIQGDENCDRRGFVWGKTSKPNPGNVAPELSGYDDNWTESGDYGAAAFSHTITGLFHETYYFRACAHNSIMWKYGDEESFIVRALFTREFIESVLASDTAVKIPYKALLDTTTVIDTARRSASKTLTDDIGVTDTITLLKKFFRVFSEPITIVDAIKKSSSKIFTDNINILEPAALPLGWAKSIELTLDHNDIDAVLSNFPVLIHLSSSSGRNSKDVTKVFDEVGANRKKIAVTTSDGLTQCYVEVEKWDSVGEEAWLWVKIPSVSDTTDTILYLYYDNAQADNTDYVGDPSDDVVHNVWDSNFKLVTHMRDDPDTSHIRDSTVNANDGTKRVANEPIEADGKIDKAQSFDGVNDYVQVADDDSLDATSAISIEAWIKFAATTDNQMLVTKWDAGSNERSYAVQTEGINLRWKMFISTSGINYASVVGTVNHIVDTWYHFVGVYNGSEIKYYTDGNLDDTLTPSISGNLHIGTSNLRIGDAVALGGKAFFNGLIDEVRISNTVRTAAWIKASYESERDDLIAFGDEETGVVGFTKQVHKFFTDAITIVESSIVEKILHVFEKVFTETITITDSVVKQSSKVFSEAITITDAIKISRFFTKIFTEAITIADSIRKQASKTFSETITATDKLVRGRVFTDSIAITDSISKATHKTFSEFITITDHTWRTFYLALQERINVSESITTVKKFFRIFAEAMTIVDSTRKQTKKTLIDSIAIADSISLLKKFFRSFTESIIMVDSVRRLSSRVLADTVTISESISKATHKTFGEFITLTDHAWKTFYLSFTEHINIADSISAVKKFFRVFSESIAISESVVKRVSKTFSESLTVVDGIRKTSARSLTDSITIVDSIRKQPVKVFSEVMNVTEAVAKRSSKVFTESILVTEIFTSIGRFIRIFTESILVSESIVTAKKFFRVFTERINVKEIFSAAKHYTRVFTEAIHITDAFTYIKNPTKIAKLFAKLIQLKNIGGF